MNPDQTFENGQFLYYHHAIPAERADELMELFHDTLEWEQKHVTIQGKTWPMPRLTAWHGTKPYMYSGVVNPAKPWTPELLELKELAEKLCGGGTTFNGVLLNLYRHHRDSLAWHSDDETEIGPNATIASMSLGGTREFHVRTKGCAPAGAKGFELELKTGSLLIMRGRSQDHYEHHVPKVNYSVWPRINLTFRHMMR